MELGTFRAAFIDMPCQIVKTARGVRWRVQAWNQRQEHPRDANQCPHEQQCRLTHPHTSPDLAPAPHQPAKRLFRTSVRGACVAPPSPDSSP